MQSRYVLGSDEAAASRLAVLDAVYGETSRSLIEQAQPAGQASLSFADIGCGTGQVTLAMADRFTKLTGIDEADSFICTASLRATERKALNVVFLKGNANTPPLPPNSFDCVYSRCLLSHLAEPLTALKAMVTLARPGGVVCIEDIDCGGVFAHPEATALMRHADLYQKIVRLNGGDPLLGRKLPRLCRRAGLTSIRHRVVRPAEPSRAIKQLYAMTLSQLEGPLVEAGLCTANEVESLVAQLQALAADLNVKIPATPMVQVWARKL